MKAAQINEYGDATAVKVNEIEKPAAGEGQVLIEVHASSINPFDAAVRTGYVQQMMPLDLPATLGGDIAGIVSEVGTGVTGFAVGDKVWGQAAAVSGNSGAFAEFAVTTAGQISKAPANIDFVQAGSLPLVGASAIQGLYSHIQLAEGQKILITGGSGGIGSIAIQIAKHIGAHVTATASGVGIEVARRVGADEVLDYKSDSITALSHDFDAVFDTAGVADFDDTLRLLKPGGIAISMAALPNQELASELHVTALGQMTKVTTEALEKLRELVESGVVTPQVDTVFNLDRIAEAFQAKEAGNVRGKVVIKIQ